MAKRPSVPVVPASLIVEGRPCLVVGGGKIALGKINHLIAGKALVTVIAPELCDDLQELSKSQGLTHIKRIFGEDYLNGSVEGARPNYWALVYAATSDHGVNLAIIEACRSRGILCCGVDKSWPEGDFVTPAVIRGTSVTVAVSSGGASCRRSRVIKQELSRHLQTVEGSDLFILGTSHRELALEKREPFHLAGQSIEKLGSFLTQLRGIQEFMVLNTCNRVELIALAENSPELIDLLKSHLGYDQLSHNEYYCLTGVDAFAHLSELTAGLYSQTPGENHIVAQVKEAFAVSQSFGWSRLVLKQWIDTTLHVSRHIRQASAPYLRQVELEDICLEFLQRQQTEKPAVMIIGTGVIGEGLKKRFHAQGYPILWCYHQNCPALTGSESSIKLVQLKDFRKHLAEVSSVLCATGSSEFILTEEMGGDFARGNETWLLDLSMPRNIDKGLDKGSVNVIDLDDLKHWFRREAADWSSIEEKSRKEIEEHREDYEKIVQSFTDRG